ncbi:substrate-binding domain-containing protein [Collimonas pratensis]|uniref:Periplasmic binding domain protein n=1 Tax=Collimonas pratensis TaxID=279113 RepID=A0A127QX00_9BURK|nr:substrate-binding domain-containing protein [Collimonas pratensis]AMP05647.1 periplasmic binding domain protein [Collimonas pratensis]AMP14315.1 periplasmic binding domain protein [Collimonas pratensis]NKI69000.1 substrate-binding domain-containing protein [Collimonas pratensis]
MKFTNFNFVTVALVFGFISSAFAQEDPTLFLNRANAKIAKAMAFKNSWDGPTSGPKISAQKKLIVVIASNLKNNSVLRVSKGVQEAAAVAGWEVFVIDCWGVDNKHAEAFSRALALKPSGIVLAGIDANEQPKEMNAANAQNVPVVGWHASTRVGPSDGLFSNVTADPKEEALIASLLGVVDSNGKAGVVVFTDPASLYSQAKSNEVVAVIKQCRTCSLLSVEALPIATSPDKLPALLATLQQRFGKKWTHIIGVNDSYLDLLATPASMSLLANNKIQALSAGEGSETAYQRIRSKNLQIATVPEPFGQQGWQIIDELNRAFAGEKASAYTTPAYLVTEQNIAFHGGDKNTFEPNNGYRAEYKKIWGK